MPSPTGPQSTPALPAPRRFFRAAWLAPLIVGALALALGLVARYLWIEPREMGLACADIPTPWWCGPRVAAVYVHQYNGWGLAALAAGLIALFSRAYWLALVGLAAGLMGLVLYNAGLAAVGLLAALLVIVRR
ncbi:MAG: hypothetical protein ABUL54_04000 [Dongia sp.]